MVPFGRYFHVYVFAAFSLGASISVALNDESLAEEIAPAVHEAVAFARYLEASAEKISLASVADEAIELYATILRFPSLLLENVSDGVNDISLDGSAAPQAGGQGRDIFPVHMQPAGPTVIETEI